MILVKQRSSSLSLVSSSSSLSPSLVVVFELFAVVLVSLSSLASCSYFSSSNSLDVRDDVVGRDLQGVVLPGVNPNQAIEVELDYELRSKASDPSSLYQEVNNEFFNALFDAISDHDGDNALTMMVQSVDSNRIGDCIEDITMPTNMACDMVKMNVIVSLNRPQFDPAVARQAMYDFARIFFDQYTQAINQINVNNQILARLAFPITVTTRCRVGFSEFGSTSITEKDRSVMTNAFLTTVSPIMANLPAPSFQIKSAVILMQDIRPEGLFQTRRTARRRKHRRTTTTTTTTTQEQPQQQPPQPQPQPHEQPTRTLEDQQGTQLSSSNVLLYTDFFVRAHCRITEPSCRDDVFNQTLYSKLLRNDPDNNDITGMEIYIQNLKIQGRTMGTVYFEEVPSVQMFSATDNYYDQYDRYDQQQLLMDNIQHLDPDIYHNTGTIPIWLWLFLFASIIILLVGIPSLYCAQRQWEKHNRRNRQNR